MAMDDDYGKDLGSEGEEYNFIKDAESDSDERDTYGVGVECTDESEVCNEEVLTDADVQESEQQSKKSRTITKIVVGVGVIIIIILLLLRGCGSGRNGKLILCSCNSGDRLGTCDCTEGNKHPDCKCDDLQNYICEGVCKHKADSKKASGLGVADKNGGLTVELTPEEVEAKLDVLRQEVSKGEIVFSINASPVVSKERMNVMFENLENAKNLLHLKVVDRKTGEIIYETSQLQPPNSNLEFAEGVKLSKGEYLADAVITSYDVESHQKIGELETELIIRAL